MLSLRIEDQLPFGGVERSEAHCRRQECSGQTPLGQNRVQSVRAASAMAAAAELI
jgi:hypothetical protein